MGSQGQWHWCGNATNVVDTTVSSGSRAEPVRHQSREHDGHSDDQGQPSSRHGKAANAVQRPMWFGCRLWVRPRRYGHPATGDVEVWMQLTRPGNHEFAPRPTDDLVSRCPHGMGSGRRFNAPRLVVAGSFRRGSHHHDGWSGCRLLVGDDPQASIAECGRRRRQESAAPRAPRSNHGWTSLPAASPSGGRDRGARFFRSHTRITTFAH